MAEEGGDWFTDAAADEAPAAGVDGAPAAATDGGAPAAAGGGGGDSAAPLPEEDVPPPPEDDGYRKPLTLYRHWVRPQFLQYKYMYGYRTNYYDDVIDYLDKRGRGLTREIPRAQTWAERVLRKSNSDKCLADLKYQKREDSKLIQTLSASIKTHNYHTKAYINRKYSTLL